MRGDRAPAGQSRVLDAAIGVLLMLWICTAQAAPLPPPPPYSASASYSDFASLSGLQFLGATKQASGKVLQLTPAAKSQVGMVMLKKAVQLTYAPRAGACAPIRFSTSFSFSLQTKGSDGIAFVISPVLSNLGQANGNLGWGGARPVGTAQAQPSLAVELDSHKDAWDPSGNHVGLDLSYQVKSVAAADVTGVTNLADGGRKYVWIDYNGIMLTVRLSATAAGPATAVLSTAVNMCTVLKGQAKAMYIGFSASTAAGSYQFQNLYSWFWQSSIPASPPPPSPPKAPPAPPTARPPPYYGPPLGLDLGGPYLNTSFLNGNFRHASVFFTGNNKSSSWQLPGSVDWRTSGVLPPVQDMRPCAGSWAFAAAAAVDSGWAISFQQSAPVSSRQQILDCTSRATDSCQGGHPLDALEYTSRQWAASQGGLVDGSYYAYAGAQNPACDTKKAKQGQYDVAMYERVAQFGWLGLAVAVAVQPVVVSLVGSWSSFYKYNGSYIYSDPDCFASTYVPDLSVLLVGFNLAGDTPYWIIQNSWGTTWGDKGYGYIKIVGGDGICGLQSTPGVYPVMAGLSPCAGINPCGSGVCSVTPNGLSNTCACPDQFVPYTNLDGSQSCAPLRVCSYSLYNPCGQGTCIDDLKGSYRCICPPNLSPSLLSSGLPTCVIGNTQLSYAVRQGDTCYFIYSSYGLSQDQLVAQNPGLNCSRPLVAGSVLNVTSTVANSCHLLYSIQSGDTCPTIYSTFGLTALSFHALNPGVKCYPTDTTPGLVPGQQVCVANGTFVPWNCAQTVVPQPGDTCQSIQSRYNITAFNFYLFNQGINCANLLSTYGQQVCVDGVKVSATLCWRQYSVRRGDTCARLYVSQYKALPALFARLNKNLGLCLDRRLITGMVLCVPWW